MNDKCEPNDDYSLLQHCNNTIATPSQHHRNTIALVSHIDSVAQFGYRALVGMCVVLFVSSAPVLQREVMVRHAHTTAQGYMGGCTWRAV